MLSNHPSVLGGGAVSVTTPAATSASLDLISSTQGATLYRNATAWVGLNPGTSGQLLSTQGAAANPIWVTATGGAGDFNGPASATDNAIVRFDGTGGKTGQNSAVTIADTTGDIAGASSLTAPASTALTLSGGTSGASLVLGQGATGVATFTMGTPSTGKLNIGAANVFVTGGDSGIWFNATDTFAIGIYESGDGMRFRTSGGDKMTLASTTGNLLIGTTTDMTGSAGLKVAGTTASTGVGSGALQVAGGIYAGAASVFGSSATFAGAVSTTNGNITLTKTGSDAALTLNGGVSSYAFATFNPNASTTNNFAILAETGGVVYFQQNNGAVTKMMFAAGVNGGITFATGTGGITSTGTGAATFAGAVAIGNTVAVAVAAASTHKVTMVIGGVTYYLLASNV